MLVLQGAAETTVVCVCVSCRPSSRKSGRQKRVERQQMITWQSQRQKERSAQGDTLLLAVTLPGDHLPPPTPSESHLECSIGCQS